MAHVTIAGILACTIQRVHTKNKYRRDAHRAASALHRAGALARRPAPPRHAIAARSMSGKRKRSTGGPSAGGDGEEDDNTSGRDDAASFMASKYRESLDGAANEFLCPITQELPVEPVTAMDGKVYERKAIEDWFRQGNGNSPMTNQPMSTQLLPATHVRNSLELMVKSGALTGEKVDAWQKKLKEEETMAKLLEKAQAGDVTPWHGWGKRTRSRRSITDAIAWFRRGADAGSMDCLSMLGRFHVFGDGMTSHSREPGLMMITEAAANGNQHACFSWLCFKKGFPKPALQLVSPS